MAIRKKARPARKTKAPAKGKSAVPVQPLARLQSTMKKLQKDAEKLLKNTRRQATDLISRDQKKALDRLLSQAERARKDIEKRIKRATKDIEARTKQVLVGVEKQTTSRVNSLLKRLDVPSRGEIRNLSRRLSDLEKQLKVKGAAPKAAAKPAPAPTAPPPPLSDLPAF